jgi:hypothetical protein
VVLLTRYRPCPDVLSRAVRSGADHVVRRICQRQPLARPRLATRLGTGGLGGWQYARPPAASLAHRLPLTEAGLVGYFTRVFSCSEALGQKIQALLLAASLKRHKILAILQPMERWQAMPAVPAGIEYFLQQAAAVSGSLKLYRAFDRPPPTYVSHHH